MTNYHNDFAILPDQPDDLSTARPAWECQLLQVPLHVFRELCEDNVRYAMRLATCANEKAELTEENRHLKYENARLEGEIARLRGEGGE